MVSVHVFSGCSVITGMHVLVYKCFDKASVYLCVVLILLQVIVEKVPKSSIPDIDKKKFLVPADLSGKLSSFIFTTHPVPRGIPSSD